MIFHGLKLRSTIIIDKTKSRPRKTPVGWDHNGPGSSSMRETCTVYHQPISFISILSEYSELSHWQIYGAEMTP